MKINNKSISIAFVIILAATVIISLAGMLLMSRQPLVLQGQVEATEIFRDNLLKPTLYENQ